MVQILFDGKGRGDMKLATEELAGQIMLKHCPGIGPDVFAMKLMSSGTQIGCMLYKVEHAGQGCFVTLLSVTVDECYRRRGLGSLLLNRVVDAHLPWRMIAYPISSESAEWLLSCGFERSSYEDRRFINYNPRSRRSHKKNEQEKQNECNEKTGKDENDGNKADHLNHGEPGAAVPHPEPGAGQGSVPVPDRAAQSEAGA